MDGIRIFVAELVENGFHSRGVLGSNELTDGAFEPSGKRTKSAGREQHRTQHREQHTAASKAR